MRCGHHNSPRIGWADLLPLHRLPTFQDTYGGVLVHVSLHHSLEYEYRQPIPRALFSESQSLDCPGFTAGGVTWHLRVVTSLGQRKRDGRSTRGDYTLVDAGAVSLYVILDSDHDSEAVEGAVEEDPGDCSHRAPWLGVIITSGCACVRVRVCGPLCGGAGSGGPPNTLVPRTLRVLHVVDVAPRATKQVVVWV